MAALFNFERPPERQTKIRGYRDGEMAKAELAVLRERLAIPDKPALDPEAERLLLRYCMDVPLNIAWYDRARADAQKALVGETRKYVAAALVVALVTMVPAFYDFKQTAGAQVSAMAGALLFVLRLMGSTTNKKVHVSAFHKASADLKEALYTFEQTWHGKVRVDDAGKLDAASEAAIWQALREARRIARDERDAFFGALRSPTDILGGAGQELAALSSAVASVGTARRLAATEATAAARPFAEALDKLVAAKVSQAVAEARLGELASASAPASEIDAARKEKVLADVEVARCEALVEALRHRVERAGL